MEKTESVLEIRGISKEYEGKFVLNNVSLTIPQGHCYGILGENGAGKSTLYRIVSGKAKATYGSILVDGADITKSSLARSRVFCSGDGMYFPERIKLYGILKIMKNLSAFDYCYADLLLRNFGISSHKRFGQLSRGERSLFGAILALASKADFIILDEPVLGVDLNSREVFYKELAKQVAKEEKTYIVTTHLIDEIQDLLEYVAVLRMGEVVAEGKTEEVVGQAVAISGPSEKVEDATENLEVIRDERFAGYRHRVVYIPDDGIDLEKLCDAFEIEVRPVDLETVFKALNTGRMKKILTGRSDSKNGDSGRKAVR